VFYDTCSVIETAVVGLYLLYLKLFKVPCTHVGNVCTQISIKLSSLTGLRLPVFLPSCIKSVILQARELENLIKEKLKILYISIGEISCGANIMAETTFRLAQYKRRRMLCSGLVMYVRLALHKWNSMFCGIRNI